MFDSICRVYLMECVEAVEQEDAEVDGNGGTTMDDNA